jgi:hypothetical protein
MKKILLALLVAASLGAVSTTAVAETDKGRITYEPAEAIDMVAGKIKVAIDAIDSGTDGEAVAGLIKDASDASKEVNANDKVDNARAKANNKLKNARKLAKESALQQAGEELKAAHKAFLDLKSLL